MQLYNPTTKQLGDVWAIRASQELLNDCLLDSIAEGELTMGEVTQVTFKRRVGGRLVTRYAIVWNH